MAFKARHFIELCQHCSVGALALLLVSCGPDLQLSSSSDEFSGSSSQEDGALVASSPPIRIGRILGNSLIVTENGRTSTLRIDAAQALMVNDRIVVRTTNKAIWIKEGSLAGSGWVLISPSNSAEEIALAHDIVVRRSPATGAVSFKRGFSAAALAADPWKPLVAKGAISIGATSCTRIGVGKTTCAVAGKSDQVFYLEATGVLRAVAINTRVPQIVAQNVASFDVSAKSIVYRTRQGQAFGKVASSPRLLGGGMTTSLVKTQLNHNDFEKAYFVTPSGDLYCEYIAQGPPRLIAKNVRSVALSPPSLSWLSSRQGHSSLLLGTNGMAQEFTVSLGLSLVKIGAPFPANSIISQQMCGRICE
jgi:hypothetical protein